MFAVAQGQSLDVMRLLRASLGNFSRVQGFVAIAVGYVQNWPCRVRVRAGGGNFQWVVCRSALRWVGCLSLSGGLPWPVGARRGCVGPSHPVEPRLIAVISHSSLPSPSLPPKLSLTQAESAAPIPVPVAPMPLAQHSHPPPPHLPGSRGEGGAAPTCSHTRWKHAPNSGHRVVGWWAVTD